MYDAMRPSQPDNKPRAQAHSATAHGGSSRRLQHNRAPLVRFHRCLPSLPEAAAAKKTGAGTHPRPVTHGQHGQSCRSRQARALTRGQAHGPSWQLGSRRRSTPRSQHTAPQGIYSSCSHRGGARTCGAGRLLSAAFRGGNGTTSARGALQVSTALPSPMAVPCSSCHKGCHAPTGWRHCARSLHTLNGTRSYPTKLLSLGACPPARLQQGQSKCWCRPQWAEDDAPEAAGTLKVQKCPSHPPYFTPQLRNPVKQPWRRATRTETSTATHPRRT